MSIFDIFKGNKDSQVINLNDEQSIIKLFNQRAKTLYVREIIIEKYLSLIASSVAKCEFKTYEIQQGKRKKVEKVPYYILNVQCNPNEVAYQFWERAIRTLLIKKELLIVNMKDKIFIADTFQKNDMVLEGKTFHDVTIDHLLLHRSFSMNEVVYLQIYDKIIDVIYQFDKEFSELVSSVKNSTIQSNLKNFIVRVPVNFSVVDEKTGEEIPVKRYLKKLIGELEQDRMNFITLPPGLEIDELKTSETKSSKELTELLESEMKMMAVALNIPTDLFMGAMTEKSQSMDVFLSTKIKPIVKQLGDGVNACFVGKENYLKGERISIDMNRIPYINPLDKATSLDKLFTIGFSHNRLLDMLDMEEEDAEWANEAYVTKNYDKAKNQTSMKGGDA